MALTDIPALKYEISGDLINLEQGGMETSYISLHRIHLEHLAKEMKIDIREPDTSPQLADYLERINEQAEYLYGYLAGVPSFPSQEQLGEDVLAAKELMETANAALGYCGRN